MYTKCIYIFTMYMHLLSTRRRSASRDQSHDTECPPASRRLSHTRPSSSTRTDPCRSLTTSEFDQ